MNNKEKTITVEWIYETKKDERKLLNNRISNPIVNNYSESDKLSTMICNILNEEFPHLRNNSLLHDIVLYNLVEKIKTVQSVENVLSYIKSNNAKQIQDISFNNGDVRIKCSI